MRGIIAALAVALAACSEASPRQKKDAPAASARAASAPARAGRKLVVVGINDTHGALLAAPASRALAPLTDAQVGGADWFAGYLNAIRAEARAAGDAVVVLDAGDQFQGTLVSNQFQGRSVVDVYNAIGVTAAAIGNHELDFGIGVLEENEKRARYPMLAANVFLAGTRTRPAWAKPSVLVEQDGIRVGIIGLATEETPLTTNPLYVEGLTFAAGGPIAAEEADALRARGAQVVLITAHAGPYPPGHEIQRIAEACRGKVDAIVSGHHHTAIKPPLVVADIPIVQSGASLTRFSTIELSLDAANHRTSFQVNQGNVPESGAPQPILHGTPGAPAVWHGRAIEPDERVAAIVGGYAAQVQKLRDSPIGETAVELRKGGENLLANLATDALRSGAGGALKAPIALQNSGGLRVASIPAGPITFGQIFDLYPFDNRQVVVELKAQAVRDALETVLRLGKGPLGVSGLRYTIDWTRFASAGEIKQAPPGALVTSIVEDATGETICETKSCTPRECRTRCSDATYPVSVADFLANGGDGLTMLKDAPRRIGPVLCRDIIVAYVKEHRPLTARLLGAQAAGARPRIQQNGAPRRGQAD